MYRPLWSHSSLAQLGLYLPESLRHQRGAPAAT